LHFTGVATLSSIKPFLLALAVFFVTGFIGVAIALS
jgi:hypothetical protein